MPRAALKLLTKLATWTFRVLDYVRTNAACGIETYCLDYGRRNNQWLRKNQCRVRHWNRSGYNTLESYLWLLRKNQCRVRHWNYIHLCMQVFSTINYVRTNAACGIETYKELFTAIGCKGGLRKNQCRVRHWNAAASRRARFALRELRKNQCRVRL